MICYFPIDFEAFLVLLEGTLIYDDLLRFLLQATVEVLVMTCLAFFNLYIFFILFILAKNLTWRGSFYLDRPKPFFFVSFYIDEETKYILKKKNL